MIKEKQIRTIIPFVIVLASTFFMSGQNLFEDFGSKLELVRKNEKLLALLLTGDGMQAIGSLTLAVIFFRSWYNNRLQDFWFNDMMWQLAGAFACWFVACVVSMIGNVYLYMWLTGLFKLCTGIFIIYVSNTAIAARGKLYHPETPQEALRKAKAFEELSKIIKNTSQ